MQGSTMDTAVDDLPVGAETTSLDTPTRHALGERLRKSIRDSGTSDWAAVIPAADLAVAIHTTVPKPSSTVFWDAGTHTEAYRHLVGQASCPFVPVAPGRALSNAVGTAIARTLQQKSASVVAVIDGQGLSAGLAFEAVTHAGHLHLPLIVALVDAPAIRTRSVGAVSRHLTRLRGHPRYADAKTLIEQALSRIPAGGQAVEVARRIKNSMRELLVPTAIWEELLGFMYLGPIDGTNPTALHESLMLALAVRRPVLLHISIPAAEALARCPADADGLGISPHSETWLSATALAITDIAGEDKSFVAISAGRRARAALQPVADRVPERFLDVELGESHGITLAASLARQDLHPLLVMPASQTFAAVAPMLADQHSAKLPVTILAYPDDPSAVPPNVAALRAFPGLKLIVPTRRDALAGLVKTAVQTDGWTVIHLPTETLGRLNHSQPHAEPVLRHPD